MTRLPNQQKVVTEPPRLALQKDTVLSWTDDLPVCVRCGYGSSTNQIYRQDGVRRESHEFEDRSFHFSLEGGSLYGVFDGHDGHKAAHFAEQRMPAELLLGQLVDKTTDDQVKDVLLQAFEAVEKGFFESIDDLLAVKANLLLQFPEGVNFQDACDQFPDLASQLQELEAHTASGCTATLALIHGDKLYVANCGNSRVLLCRRDNGGLRVQQLTMDHTIWDPDEQIRLSNLGADMKAILRRGTIGNMVYTRCIGDYKVKVAYKDIDYLSQSRSDPILSDPYVSEGIPLDESCQFLILMTDGLYTSLQDALGCNAVNAEIASMVASEFQVQATLNGVAQAVVDRVIRIHHDIYMTTSSDDRRSRCQIRDDLTLLVRNFHCPLAVSSPTGLYPVRKSSAPSAYSSQQSDKSEKLSNNALSNNTSTNDSTDSAESLQHSVTGLMDIGIDGRIASYVSFDSYFEALDEMGEEQRSAFEASLKAVPACPPIQEDAEVHSPGTDYS